MFIVQLLFVIVWLFLKLIVRLWNTEVIREPNYWCTVLMLGHMQFGGLFGHDGSAENFTRDL
jgi:hypothetical protein